MDLIKARVRGLGTTPYTDWFDIAPGTTCLADENPERTHLLLRALATINPQYDCVIENPFKGFPDTELRGGYSKKVYPEKRTIAISVFSADSTLVEALAEINELLYETDRIEVGRRLDYSSWLNFVELASSSRFSEVVDELKLLSERYEHTVPETIAATPPTQRISGALMEQLGVWVQSCAPNATEHDTLAAQVLNTIYRARDFQLARLVVAKHLPRFIHIDKHLPPDQRAQSVVAEHASSQIGGHRLSQYLVETGLDEFLGVDQRGDDGEVRILHHALSDAHPHWQGVLKQAGYAAATATMVDKVQAILLVSLGSIDATPDAAVLDFFRVLGKHCQCIYGCNLRQTAFMTQAGATYDISDICENSADAD